MMQKMMIYLLYLAGLLILVFLGGNHLKELNFYATWNVGPLPAMLFSWVYSMLVGMYIALPQLVATLRKDGELGLDWLRILIIGLPMLLLSATGILSYYLAGDLNQLIQWIYVKYHAVGILIIGIAFGYTLLSSLIKRETREMLAGKIYIAKIAALIILGTVLFYIFLNGVIHPVKLTGVTADIVEIDDQASYNGGTETIYFIQTEIMYMFQVENIPYIPQFSQWNQGPEIWLEPKEKLQSLLAKDIFKQASGIGYSHISSKQMEIRLTYLIGSVDPEGRYSDRQPPSPEVLAEIKDALYEADLVIQWNGKEIKRFDLSAYKKT